jgi:hypothetical protein
MPNRPRTISVLIERNLISLKCIAASNERALLIDRAHYEFLHLSPGTLRQLDETGKCAVSDLTDATIEEVEVLYAGEGPEQMTINERTER